MKKIVMLTMLCLFWSCLFGIMATDALADPVPGNPKIPVSQGGIFCIQPTLIEDIGFGDTRIIFEVVNWNHDIADALNLNMGFGPNQTLPTTSLVSAGFGLLNDWTVSSASPSLAQFSIGGGTPIPNIDLAAPFLNPFFPNAPDSGSNTRRDFEVVVSGWGPSERLVFDWNLNLPGGPDLDSFDSGNWTMDRSSDSYSTGSPVRVTTWEQPRPTPTNGFAPFDFASNPIDPSLTDQNATFVPEPSSLLLASCLFVVVGCWRRPLR